ncbi:MAG: CcoQ/FixQ family Cbb3-type cytochrome c oxidase assembly chaperone [Fidelibacterota bacterium]
MIRELLSSIDGVGIYPTIALFIFMGIFLAAVVHAYQMDKDYAKEMSELPLDKSKGDNRSSS